MKNDDKKTALTIRVPVSFKSALEIIAKDETRSISQQVEHFLKVAIKEYSLESNNESLTETLFHLES